MSRRGEDFGILTLPQPGLQGKRVVHIWIQYITLFSGKTREKQGIVGRDGEGAPACAAAMQRMPMRVIGI